MRQQINKWIFPAVISIENKYSVGFGMFIVAGGLYLLSNWYHFFEPRYLPFWKLDRMVPFLPWSVLIYVSEYLLFSFVFIVCKNVSNLNRYFYSFLSLQTVSVIIFVLWPTTYPRDQFPLPANLDRFTLFVFTALREADTPASCCPSLHVSSVYLSSFLFLNENKKLFVIFFTWATLIALTTLTTKQHYVVDVLAGLLMAFLFHWFYQTRVTYSTNSKEP